MALLALQNTPKDQAVHELKRKFSISSRKVSNDYTQFILQLNGLIDPNGSCPIHAMNFKPFHLSQKSLRLPIEWTWR